MAWRPFINDWRTLNHSWCFGGRKSLYHLRHRNWTGCVHHQTDRREHVPPEALLQLPFPAQTCSKADRGSCCPGLTFLLTCSRDSRRQHYATFGYIRSIDTNKSESALRQDPAEVVPCIPKNLGSSCLPFNFSKCQTGQQKSTSKMWNGARAPFAQVCKATLCWHMAEQRSQESQE